MTVTQVPEREALRIRIERSLIVSSNDTENPSRSEFSRFLHEACECGIKINKLAGLIDVKQEVIGAWATGKEDPGVFKRRQALRWLKALLM